jgi:hypothetical protein
MRAVAVLAVVLLLAASACSLNGETEEGGGGTPATSEAAPPPPQPPPAPRPLLSEDCADGAARLDGRARERATQTASLAGQARGLQGPIRNARKNARRARAELEDEQATLTAAEGALESFQAAHPEQTLPPELYAQWQDLRAAYESAYEGYRTAFQAHRKTLQAHNRLVEQRNAIVRKLNRHSRAYAELARRHRRLLRDCLAEDTELVEAEAPFVRQLEERLAGAVSTLAERPATVDCSFTEWSAGENVAGFVAAGSSVVHLAPEICYSLHRLLILDDAPDLACLERSRRARAQLCSLEGTLAAAALQTAAHEAQHVAGITNEAQAECYGLQTVGDAARLLDVGDTRSLAWYAWRLLRRPPAYRSEECKAGGELDLDPATMAWP